MAVKFNDDDKVEMGNGNWFREGVHPVNISNITFDETENGKAYVEFDVLGENEEEGSARFWFSSDGARKYAFGNIRNIYVHNAPEDKKDKARKAFDQIEDTDELKKACEDLVGGEAWYKVEKDPERTYPAKDGTMKPSINKDLYGYEPKMVNPKTNVEKIIDGDVPPKEKVDLAGEAAEKFGFDKL